jgi:hypothetical protein
MSDAQLLQMFRWLLGFSGTFNIAMAAPLIVPQVYKQYFALLSALNERLALGGDSLVAPPDGINALLINTAGIDLVLIGVFVLYAAMDPIHRWFIPAANAVGRTAFAGVVTYYAVVHHLARFVFALGLVDVMISIGFVYYLYRLRQLIAPTA